MYTTEGKSFYPQSTAACHIDRAQKASLFSSTSYTLCKHPQIHVFTSLQGLFYMLGECRLLNAK